jgi:LysM repeat protein
LELSQLSDQVVIYYVAWHGTIFECNLLSGTYWGVPSMDRLGARRRALDWAGIPWKDWPHGEPANMDEFGVELVIGEARNTGNGVNRLLYGGGRGDGGDRLGDMWGQGGNIVNKLDQVLAALRVAPTPPPPPAATPTYTVKSGDTLSGIAKANGVAVADLQAWNGITDPNNISIGQVLRLTSP